MRDLFFDLDDTLLDFGQAEHAAVQKAFRDVGITPTPALLQRYSQINAELWEQLARDEITRDTLLVLRFDLLFREMHINVPGIRCEERYRKYLAIGHYFVPGAENVLAWLAPKYRLYLASNGVADTQYSRIASAGIGHYFQAIFISEDTGYHKPERKYFDYCFARIPDFDPSQAMIIGDSLTSDILGGKRAGIQTCWFNPGRKPGRDDILPDYEIHALEELKTFL